MELLHALRNHNKSWLPRSLIESAIIKEPKVIISGNFPRKTGFNNLTELAHTTTIIDHKTELGLHESDPVDILNLASNTGHLGKEYTDYMLLNIHECLYLISALKDIYTEGSKHLLYSHALSQLITINLYRKKYNHPHSLPKNLSRKFINIQLVLFKYLDEHGS